jgi:hypothetical protein
MNRTTRTRHRSRHVVFAVLASAALLTALPFEAAASRGKVFGRVTDARTKEPLIGVNVVIVGTTMGGSTDLQGEYFIANVPVGTYDLKASMIGYRDVVVTGARVYDDRTTEVHFEMTETVIEFGETVVVSAQRPLVEKDNTASRIVVEAREISTRPATEFSDVFSTLPGVTMDGGVMRVRGGTLDGVAFLVDGTRARNPLDQSAYINFNLSAIKELEVITGSFNAEYGEAQSGVVKITTKDGGPKFHFFIDGRYTPPGVRHWGVGLYDRNTSLYWENTNARHLQWWIDNPDQWVDPNGYYGNDARSIWTPEEAYSDYLATHGRLTNYASIPSYQIESSFSGPVPFFSRLNFFLSGKYRTQAPLFGNAYRDRGEFINGTGKFTYTFSPAMKLNLSLFYGQEKTSWGIGDWPDYEYARNFGYQSRYAFYDYPGLPDSRTDMQSLKFSHVLDAFSMYEVEVARAQAYRKTDVFPDDPNGWEASGVTRTDNLRAVDANGNPIPGAYANPIGFNTLGYYFRNDDINTEWRAGGRYSNQFNKNWKFETGTEFSYYHLRHYNESKRPAIDAATLNPYQGAVWVQSKLEFGGFIMNPGLRFDFYNPNDTVYTDPFDPFNSPREPTKTFSQLSPRLGIAHPIDERTVLHFSYGYFFQRGKFGDYGEGYSESEALGNLTRSIDPNTGLPIILGNRQTRPSKTVQFEVGVERNFAEVFVLGVTGYYKDISNTVRAVQVSDPTKGITYRTNGNADYADERGVEISLRKQPSHYIHGYVNFSTQFGITGRSGDPVVVYPDRKVYGPSGDAIQHRNPRMNGAIVFHAPPQSGLLWGLADDLLVSLEYLAVFPNEKILGDKFQYSDSTYSASKLRPVDQRWNMRLSKGFSFFDSAVRMTAFIQVTNLLNHKWINFGAIDQASGQDQKAFIQSDFEDIPTHTASGVPILDTAKYRNLPRSILFGMTLEL